VEREQARLTETLARGRLEIPVLVDRLHATASPTGAHGCRAIWRQRAAFRELLTERIKFTPYVERGYRAIRFEGKIGLDAVFQGEVSTNVASPRGLCLSGRGKCPAKSKRRKPSVIFTECSGFAEHS
jgi:hypothetical protein